jgi:ribosomal protein L32
MVDQVQPSDADKTVTMPSQATVIPDNNVANALVCPECGKPIGLAERLCKHCGHDLTYHDMDETKLREDIGELPALTDQAKAAEVIALRNCPNCGRALQAGDRLCFGCGHFLHADPEDTNDFSNQLEEKRAVGLPFPGKLPANEEVPIIFEIDGAHLILPAGQLLVVGRRSSRQNDSQPDVDLGAFSALEKGVSRRHIMIKRRGTLAYVADIGSANGTWLNGHHLILNGERLLRHGDELQLSHLKIKILYSL